MEIGELRRLVAEGKPRNAYVALGDFRFAAARRKDVSGLLEIIELGEALVERDPSLRREVTAVAHSAQHSVDEIKSGSLTNAGRAQLEVQAPQRAREIVSARLESMQWSRGSRDLNPMATFEYESMEIPHVDVGTYLNRAGALGWELVSVVPGDGGDRLYLKRLVSATAEGRQRSATGLSGFMYFESGIDADADGDVDGGLIDHIDGLFD